jgi:hypothetical protein
VNVRWLRALRTPRLPKPGLDSLFALRYCGPMKLLNRSLIAVVVTLSTLGGAFLAQASQMPPTAAELEQAKTAWNGAIELAIARVEGRTCEQDAYQSAVIEKLKTAIQLNPAYAESARDVPSINKALAGNLMFAQLTGRLFTPAQVDAAFSSAYFESNDGGAAVGPRMTLRFKAGHKVDVTDVIHKTMEASYRVIQEAGKAPRLILDERSLSIHMEFELIKASPFTSFGLKNLLNEGVEYDFSNEPFECGS